jgi:15-cis-phytoene synthase
MSDVVSAYRRCEEITRNEARNFSYGIRLLPTQKRWAMSALYAFARRVDDIGDGAAPVEEKLASLALIRRDIVAMADGRPPAGDPVLVALSDALANYPIPISALGELVTGCEMDCRETRYATFEELAVYCRCVAGSIGRLSVAIFGAREPERADELANELGLALQVTNILRDIVEDREVMGRVYLPADDLSRFGCDPDATGPLEALVELVRFEAERARRHYRAGLVLLQLLDWRSRSCVSAMAGIYSRLLDRIEQDPLAVLNRRVSLPKWEKAWVAAASLAGSAVG